MTVPVIVTDLKLNEKELIIKLKSDEEALKTADSLARKQRIKDKTGGLRPDSVIKRTVQQIPQSPPVKIDIAGNLENFSDIRLSDIASDITYIRMAPIPDTTIPSDLKFRYYLMDNYIVAINLYGIHLYAKDGRYIRQIVKNEMTGVEVSPGQLRFWNDYTMKGGVSVTGVNGNRLFYNYSNNITGQKYIMEYDCSSSQLVPDYKFDPENPDKISGLGNISVDLNHGNTVPPPPRKHQGMFGGNPEAFYYDPGVQILDANTYIVRLPMMTKTCLLFLIIRVILYRNSPGKKNWLTIRKVLCEGQMWELNMKKTDHCI